MPIFSEPAQEAPAEPRLASAPKEQVANWLWMAAQAAAEKHVPVGPVGKFTGQTNQHAMLLLLEAIECGGKSFGIAPALKVLRRILRCDCFDYETLACHWEELWDIARREAEDNEERFAEAQS